VLTPSTSRLLPGDNDAAPSTSRRQTTAPPTWHCVRGGRTARPTPDLVWRAANASCSLWSRTLAGNAAPAKTVVGSGLRRRRLGGCYMGSLGPTHLIALLLAVAIIAAIGGFIASAVTRRNKRRARGFFLLGFFCGWMAGSILRGRRRGLNALGALARCVDVCPPRARIRHDTGRFAARALTVAASHVRPVASPRY
jgi:uncharacterized membrane protein YeaQ/YmgE (transglycosylase-associated protein family)